MLTIDLCSGCGGLSLAALQSGCNMLFGVDTDAVSRRSYADNLGVQALDIDLSRRDAPRRVAHAARQMTRENVDLVVGGTPCQDYSICGRGVEGQRASVTPVFARIVHRVAPTYFVMENVPNAANKDSFLKAKNMLSLAYHVRAVKLDASLYGVAQKRLRTFLVGSRRPLNAVGRDFADRLAKAASRVPMFISQVVRTEKPFLYWEAQAPDNRHIWPVTGPSPTILAAAGHRAHLPKNYQPNRKDATLDMSQVQALDFPIAKAVQGFPDAFSFDGVPHVEAWRLVGNAVPPPLGVAILRALVPDLRPHPPAMLRPGEEAILRYALSSDGRINLAEMEMASQPDSFHSSLACITHGYLRAQAGGAFRCTLKGRSVLARHCLAKVMGHRHTGLEKLEPA